MAPGSGRTAPSSVDREIHRVHPFGEGRSPQRDFTGRVHDEGIAVEHQFILAADQIDEHHRKPDLAHPRAAD